MKLFLFRWLLPILAGFLLATALPPFDQGQVGWVALIPLFFALEACTRGEAFRRGYITGLVFFGATTWWIIHVSLPGMVALVAFLALYFGVAGLFLNLLGKNENDSITHNLFVAFVGAAGWTTLEWIRGHIPFGGFGWNGLGVTQHTATPLIQFASVTGVYGVSALVFVLNYALYCTIRRYVIRTGVVRRPSWEFYITMSLACAAVMYGFNEMKPRITSPVIRAIRLALIQGDIPQTLKFDEREKPMIFDRYRTLTETATIDQVDLVVWPETATPETLRYDLGTYDVVTNAAARARAYLLTGTIDAAPEVEPVAMYNAAALVRPDGTVPTIYRKTQLVPFGEYVPLRTIFPFIKWLTPITDSFETGREYTLFNVRSLDFGVVICFEDTLPGVYRQFVKAGAEFMVNLTNDAWMKDSPAAEQHLANATFRAIETRRWLVRCTNNGVTCAVDPHGLVRDRLDPFRPGWKRVVLTIPEDLPATYYVRHGDVFVLGCAVVVAGVILWTVLRKS